MINGACLYGDGENGQPIGRVAQFHDVTDLKRLEEQLRRQQRLAAMGEMAARLAHEIRSPLGSIELFGSLLRQELATDPARCHWMPARAAPRQ